MKISASFRLGTDPTITASNPSAFFGDGRKKVADQFPPVGRIQLKSLASFDLPFLVIENAFDAKSIKCATPSEMAVQSKDAERAITAVLSSMVAAQLFPMSFAYENNGELAVNISPQNPESNDQRSYEKSISSLRGHTDASFNPSPEEYAAGEDEYAPSPDYLFLGCVRNPDCVPTRIAKLETVLATLPKRDIEILHSPSFILSPQPSFDLPSDSIRSGPVLWTNSVGKTCCRFSHRYLSADEENRFAVEALDRFARSLQNSYQEVVLLPGEILAINNRLTIHGRGEVGTNWYPAARWLVRVYANKAYTESIALDPKRPWLHS